MARKSTKPSKRDEAVTKLSSIEDAALTLQATLPKFIREVQDVKAMFVEPDKEKPA